MIGKADFYITAISAPIKEVYATTNIEREAAGSQEPIMRLFIFRVRINVETDFRIFKMLRELSLRRSCLVARGMDVKNDFSIE